MKDEQMTKDIWYDCWLAATVCMTEKTAKEIDASNWLRQIVNSALHSWHVCDERDPVATSSTSHRQDGETILCLTLTSRHFDFFHGPYEDGNVILAELYARLRHQLLGKCSSVDVKVSGYKRERIPDVFVHFEAECDPPNKVIREKVWDATMKKYVENTEWKPHDKTTVESNTMIKEKFPQAQNTGRHALWYNAAGHYTVGGVDGNVLTCIYCDEEPEVVKLAEWLFGLTFEGSGYTVADLRETLHHYSGEWFVAPEGMPEFATREATSFQALFIGLIDKVYECEVVSDGKKEIVRSVLRPASHDKTVKQYTVYENSYWVRTSDTVEERYDGPYDTEIHALQAAVSEWI